MRFLAEQRLPGRAHDRRGHGRSTQPWVGNDMDTYADDLAGYRHLDLADVSWSGSPPAAVRSPGTWAATAPPGGEAVLLGAVPP